MLPLPLDPDPDAELAAAEAACAHALSVAQPAVAGHFDELRGPAPEPHTEPPEDHEAPEAAEPAGAGGLREPWRRFFGQLGPSGWAELPQRAAEVQAQILRDGVTHNVYGSDGVAVDRPWSMGLLPLLVEPGEWRRIEAGVGQRVRLLEAILDDAYGPQRLIVDGLLPPALVLGHPGYLQALHGSTPPGGLRLHVTALDLARGPQGHWWVVAQRTQAPSGLGYVMENRLIASRVFAEPFRELRVQHLASSYRALVDKLDALAAPIARAAGDGPPRVALWTPGPYNETYFEQAYLARYLGLPLVEGADLTVRGERLFMRTVQGLVPIHGLLRRLDDDWCDPLELRPDSALGVPGLLKVVRAGQVLVANALGAGFLESPGITGFLPALSRRLLGEELSLPALPTWWCGEAAAWAAGRSQLGRCVIRPSYPDSRNFEPVVGARLDAIERAAWTRRIEADPEAYTLQLDLPHAQTPVWQPGGQLVPRTAILRVYAIADGRGGHRILPGGMTRIATHDPHALSMQRGGASLDTWVLTDGPVDTYSMLPAALRPEDLADYRHPVASRTAENLFWLGRYTERTEHLVRCAQTLATLVAEDEELPPPVLEAVSRLARDTGLVGWGVPSMAVAPRVFERAVAAALGDARGQASIAYNLAALQRVAGSLRERLSPEASRLVRAMGEDFARRLRRPLPEGVERPGAPGEPVPGGPAPELGSPATLAALDGLAQQLAALTGTQTDRMTRDDGWRLLSVGRLAERLIGLSSLLKAFFEAGALAHAAGFDSLLALADSTITYRARYQGRLEPLALLAALVMDETNPRSLACVLRRLRTELRKLPDPPGAADPVDAHATLLAHLPEQGVGLPLADLAEPAAEGRDPQADRAAVIALCERLSAAGSSLSDALGQRYFALATGHDRRLAS